MNHTESLYSRERSIVEMTKGNIPVYAVWKDEDTLATGRLYESAIVYEDTGHFQALLFETDQDYQDSDGHMYTVLVGAAQILQTKLKRPFTKGQFERFLTVQTLKADYVEKLQLWLDKATIKQYEDGLVWYDEAQLACAKLAKQYNTSTEIVSAVVSALSPGCPWDRNIGDATAVLENGYIEGVCATYKSNVRTAANILEKQDASLLSGVKVEAFHASIMNPKDSIIPCIDRWMLVSIGITHKASLGVDERTALYEAFLTLSKRQQIPVPATQAIVWSVVRDHFGGRFSAVDRQNNR